MMNQATFLSYIATLVPVVGGDGLRPFADFQNQPSSHPRKKMLQRINIGLGEITKQRDDRLRMLRNLLNRPITSTYDLTVIEGQAIINCFSTGIVGQTDADFAALLHECAKPDPLDPFGVIYIDPPWNFKAGGDRKPKYPLLRTKELKKLDFMSVAAERCALLMWTSDPFMREAFEIAEAWGFHYKTRAFNWIKTNKHANKNAKKNDYLIEDDRNFANGTGYYTMANPEDCLLFVSDKYNPPKRLSRGVRELIVSPREEHSKKPDVAYDRIEQLFPGPYLEVFARRTRPGWMSLGNEIDGQDIRDSLPELISKMKPSLRSAA